MYEIPESLDILLQGMLTYYVLVWVRIQINNYYEK